MDAMTLRRMVNYTDKGVKLLHVGKFEFVDALGQNYLEIVGKPEWYDYDFLLAIPDIEVTSQEGETTGNWWSYRVYLTSNLRTYMSNYDSSGNVGHRGIERFILFFHDDYNNLWRLMCGGGRNASGSFGTNLSDFTFRFGTYSTSTYGVFNGTLDVYVGRFKKENS